MLTSPLSPLAMEPGTLWSPFVAAVTQCAIVLLDPYGIVLSWNSGAEAIKGWRPEEVIGQHFSCFYVPDEIQAGRPQHALELAAASNSASACARTGRVFWPTF
jgi:PAS domain S-box-containing protein